MPGSDWPKNWKAFIEERLAELIYICKFEIELLSGCSSFLNTS